MTKSVICKIACRMLRMLLKLTCLSYTANNLFPQEETIRWKVLGIGNVTIQYFTDEEIRKVDQKCKAITQAHTREYRELVNKQLAESVFPIQSK